MAKKRPGLGLGQLAVICLLGLVLAGAAGHIWAGDARAVMPTMPTDAFITEASLADILEETIEHEMEDEVITVEVQPQPEALEPVKAKGDGPQVMIYHTHSHEAYEKGDLKYKETSQWRTADNRYNIVQVGEVLTGILEDKYGIKALHNTTDHEPPKLGTAYSRSLKTLSAVAKANPSLKVFVDLHRDAYSKGMTKYVEIDGKQVAPIMLVIGTGEGSAGNGFSQKPDWEKNYQLADQITKGLQKIHPDLGRAIRVKTGRYNQHISTGCILVEAGHNENTLEQVVNAMPYLAQVLAEIMGK